MLNEIEQKYKCRSMPRLYEIAKLAIKEEHVESWFSTPHPLLDGRTPFASCFTNEGYDEVENILGRILFGIPS